MAIEIKGLGASLQGAREAIAAARRSTGDVEMAARELAMNADDVTTQLRKHNDDLLFEVSTLGNSAPPAKSSAASVEPWKPPPGSIFPKADGQQSAQSDTFPTPGAGNSATRS